MSEKILILVNKPVTIKERVIVDLSRPRNAVFSDFVKIRKYVTEQTKRW